MFEIQANSFPANRDSFLVLVDGRKETSAMSRNGFDLTAVHSLGRLYLKRMLLALFADRNLSPLRLAHFFTLISLSFIEPTVHGVLIDVLERVQS